MSELWSSLAGPDHLRRLEATVHRVVEGQHITSTRKLVDSAEEQAVLEDLIEAVKPPLPDEPGFHGLHYLLATPFRHPPLRHGSRFGRLHERGIFYGSQKLPTAFAEVAHYRFMFLDHTAADLPALTVYVSAFTVKLRTSRGVDLTRPPFAAKRDALADPDSYAVSQPLGSAMREAGVMVFRYFSARDEDGVNVGAFEPAFVPDTLGAPQTWVCTATKQRVEFSPVHLRGETPLSYERPPHPPGP